MYASCIMGTRRWDRLLWNTLETGLGLGDLEQSFVRTVSNLAVESICLFFPFPSLALFLSLGPTREKSRLQNYLDS